jgi:hypothetical protein
MSIIDKLVDQILIDACGGIRKLLINEALTEAEAKAIDKLLEVTGQKGGDQLR